MRVWGILADRCRYRCVCGDRCLKGRFHKGNHDFAKRGIHYRIVRENIRNGGNGRHS